MVARTWSVARGGVASNALRPAMAILLALTAIAPTPTVNCALPPLGGERLLEATSSTPVSNFTASINRLVELVALAGSGILALVWARVALSWFSNDITKKIQAKDRARDALIGTLLFMAAVTGLLYGLAHWVLTGS